MIYDLLEMRHSMSIITTQLIFVAISQICILCLLLFKGKRS